MAKISDLTIKDIANIKALLLKGEHQHRIAAMYDLNQGRISEINTGKRFRNILPASPTGGDAPEDGGSMPPVFSLHRTGSATMSLPF